MVGTERKGVIEMRNPPTTTVKRVIGLDSIGTLQNNLNCSDVRSSPVFSDD